MATPRTGRPRTGRPRKPAGSQQGHHKEEPSAAAAALLPAPYDALAVICIPEPPKRADRETLCNAALLLWDRFWESPMARALDGQDGVDRYVVVRWVRAIDHLERAETVVDEQGPTAEGSKGQRVLHPLLSYIAHLKVEIQGYETKLGLTPLDRAQLGMNINASRFTAHSINELLQGKRTSEVGE